MEPFLPLFFTEVIGKITDINVEVDTVIVTLSQDRTVILQIPRWKISNESILHNIEIGTAIAFLRTYDRYYIRLISEGTKLFVGNEKPGRQRVDGVKQELMEIGKCRK